MWVNLGTRGWVLVYQRTSPITGSRLGAKRKPKKGRAREAALLKHTDLAGDVRVQPAEDDVAVGELARLALAHDELAYVAHRRGLLPPHGVPVLLAGRSRRGPDGVQDEVRVLRQQQDEALADGAGATQDTCVRRGNMLVSCTYMQFCSRCSPPLLFLFSHGEPSVLADQGWNSKARENKEGKPQLTALLGWELGRHGRG